VEPARLFFGKRKRQPYRAVQHGVGRIRCGFVQTEYAKRSIATNLHFSINILILKNRPPLAAAIGGAFS
jgi:hypothetical protein